VDIEDSSLIKESENRSTQSLRNVGRLIQFLTYKARLVGKSVRKINGKHTNKKCCYCGKLRDMFSWKCVMICGCGNNIDRDRNSFINIMLRFL
jgi:putative transposase